MLNTYSSLFDKIEIASAYDVAICAVGIPCVFVPSISPKKLPAPLLPVADWKDPD